METQLMCLHITSEALRLRVAHVGAEYRVFLAWLMRVWQLLMASSQNAAASPQEALLGPNSVASVLNFLTGQLVSDCIGAQMFGKVRRLILSV